LKKYHIADILTASRFFFTAIILVMTFTAAPAAWVLVVFAIGELTDAADGPAAIRWPYPDELEQSLLWRRQKVVFDIAADMALGISALIYVALHTYPFGMTLLVGALSIGTVTQLLVVFVLPSPDKSKFTKWLVLLRRAFLYIPAVISVAVMLLLKATVPGELTVEALSRSIALRVWVGIGLAIGAALFYLKRDRIVQVGRKKHKQNS